MIVVPKLLRQACRTSKENHLAYLKIITITLDKF